MNKLQQVFYRLHLFYFWPAFWKEVSQTKGYGSYAKSVRRTFKLWQIEEESTRNL